MINKNKFITSFELTIILISIFSFAYLMGESEKNFQDLENFYIKQEENQVSSLFSFSKIILKKIKEPIFQLVSSAELDIGAGCCEVSNSNEQCVISTEEQCSSSNFAEGQTCSTTSFCQKGCCFNSDAGIFDSNVLQSDCTQEWIPDAACKIPEADRGCCVLGLSTSFGTFGQCKTDTEVFARGNNSEVDWRANLNEAQCVLLSQTQEEGACVDSNKGCTYTTGGNCVQSGGKFYKDFLCTAQELDTICKPTKETTCVEGRDGVYLRDTCGNIANIYDSNKIDDPSYWERIIPKNQICGDTSNTASANSASCGNCNRFVGSVCSPTIDTNFKVDWGTAYCKPTECIFQGEIYKNGESWCAYDGKTGDGDDVPGSRHWKYVCNQGSVDIEPCADYRNQICVQQKTFEFEGSQVPFSNAACVTNNWRECINLNSEEDGSEKCAESLNCELKKVNVSEHYTFDVCTPKYPAGFAINNERYQATSQSICNLGSRNCTAVRVSTFSGFGCKWVANKECLEDDFADQMNNVCKSLGDCGASVNINGDYVENIKILRDDDATPPTLTRGAINHLKTLSEPHPEIYAKVENYEKYLEASGFFVNPGETPTGSDPSNPSGAISKSAMGLGGLTLAGLTAGYAYAGTLGVSTASYFTTSSIGLAQLTGTASSSMAAFSGSAIGAAIGAIVGIYIAKLTGSSPLGTILLAAGGAIVGAVIGYALLYASLLTLGPFGLAAAAIGAVLMLIGSLFGTADCDPIEVQFECKPWQPPTNSNSCESCNNDPLKPCSEYRCSSLGANCELKNKGTENEICVDGSPNDTTFPIISSNILFSTDGQEYIDSSSRGFTINSESGDCVEAYTPINLGIKTDEPALCKFDFEQTEYENMKLDFGNLYLYNHTTIFPIPSPTHGEGQGLQWDGDLEIYIKCMDAKGHVTPNFFVVNTCVNKGPDRTPPLVKVSSPESGRLIPFEDNTTSIRILTNEPATCKWSNTDTSYSSMTNSLSCADSFKRPSSPFGYSCTGEVPTPNKENNFFIKCLDQPWAENPEDRNPMTQSYPLILYKPEKKLTIDSISPNQKVETNVDITNINLEIKTSGGGNYHACSYSFSGYDRLIKLFETGKERTHNQPLNLPLGQKTLYVECIDETGDKTRQESTFEIFKDSSTPQIARLWSEVGELNFITSEIAECKYSTESCSYNFENASDAGKGTFHSITSRKGLNYYIKCKDEKNNIPNTCSIIAKEV